MPLTRSQSAAASTNHFSMLDDNLVSEILYRTPAVMHAALATVCQSFRSQFVDHDFFAMRRDRGLTEPVLLAFGGNGAWRGNYFKNMLALVEGEWIYCSSPPIWGDNLYSGMLDDDLILIGGGCASGRDRDYENVGLPVHAYDVVDDAWYELSPKSPAVQNRAGAAFAQAGNRFFLAGGEVVDWDEDEPYQLTASVLELTFSSAEDGQLSLAWRTDLPFMPQVVKRPTAFVLGQHLYVWGACAEGPQKAQACLQKMDLESCAWTVCAEPLDIRKFSGGRAFSGGAVHSGRYFCLSGTCTLHAYEPDTDTWMAFPDDVPQNCWNDDVSIAGCVAGLLVFERGGGTAALINIVDGHVASVETLSSEHWSERISMFAQDNIMENLHTAAFELSAHCKPLLKKWAERIEEKQSEDEETYYEPDEDDECPIFVENLDAARLWLKTAGVPDSDERHRLFLEERAAMTEEDKKQEMEDGMKQFFGWLSTGEMR